MHDSIHIEYFATPFGELILGAYREELCLCDWRYRVMREVIDKRIQEGLGSTYLKASSEVLDRTRMQLGQYFRSERRSFDIPLRLVGSGFQQKVWNSLLQIPYGKTKTYASLAEELGDRKAIRAVAAANGANAISIIVPCHRVVGSDGSMRGYAGGPAVKKRLLILERALPQGELDFQG